MTQRLTEAGLPVPPEGNLEELLQSSFDKCMEEKSKRPAPARAPKQPAQAANATGQ